MSRESSLVARPPEMLTRMLAPLGRTSRLVAEHAGQLGLLVWNMGVAFARFRVSGRDVLRQINIVGIQSVPIVLVAAGLIGVVTSQQGGYQMQSNLPLYIMGSVVVESVILEMGPVLTAIVIGFGVQAFVLVLIKRAHAETGTDDLDSLRSTDS